MLLASAPQPISSPSNEILAVLPARTPCSQLLGRCCIGVRGRPGSICDCRTCTFKRGMHMAGPSNGASLWLKSQQGCALYKEESRLPRWR